MYRFAIQFELDHRFVCLVLVLLVVFADSIPRIDDCLFACNKAGTEMCRGVCNEVCKYEYDEACGEAYNKVTGRLKRRLTNRLLACLQEC